MRCMLCVLMCVHAQVKAAVHTSTRSYGTHNTKVMTLPAASCCCAVVLPTMLLSVGSPHMLSMPSTSTTYCRYLPDRVTRANKLCQYSIAYSTESAESALFCISGSMSYQHTKSY
jgi:hypothetical protein